MPLLREHKGRIVNIGSIAGRITTVGAGVYSATKWALEATTDAQRREMAEFGVSVSLLEPGYVKVRRAASADAIGLNAVFRVQSTAKKPTLKQFSNPQLRRGRPTSPGSTPMTNDAKREETWGHRQT